MNAQEIISSGLLEAYVMGTSAPEEANEVESYAKKFPEVDAEIRHITLAMEKYAIAHSLEPVPAVKTKLVNAIRNISPVSSLPAAKIRVISPAWKYAAAASIVLLAGSLVLNYSFYSRYKISDNELRAAQTELLHQKELAKAMHDDMGVMTDKNAMPVSLKPMPEMPDAAARIYWMQNTGDVYIDPSNLPEAPGGMQYQFWAIVDGKPVSGGMIQTLRDGRVVHVQKMKSFGKAEAFAVSLEKAGPESIAPTKVYVMGKI